MDQLNVNRNSTYSERASAPRLDEIACVDYYKSKFCYIEKLGWDLLNRGGLGLFFKNMPDLFSDIPDFMVSNSNCNKFTLVEAKLYTKAQECWSIKVKHWEAYKEWAKLCEDKGMFFYFFFFNPKLGIINVPFKRVQHEIENYSVIELLDKGKYNEKETYRFSVGRLVKYNV